MSADLTFYISLLKWFCCFLGGTGMVGSILFAWMQGYEIFHLHQRDYFNNKMMTAGSLFYFTVQLDLLSFVRTYSSFVFSGVTWIVMQRNGGKLTSLITWRTYLENRIPLSRYV